MSQMIEFVEVMSSDFLLNLHLMNIRKDILSVVCVVAPLGLSRLSAVQ